VSEIILYLHIVGAITLFSGLIAAAVAMLRMERAEDETRRELASMARAMASMATGGGGLALMFGLYLVLSGDEHNFGEAWIDNSLILLLVMVVYIGMTRIVVQSGVVYVPAPFSPQALTLAVTGTAIAPQNLVALSLSYSWCSDIQSIFMPAAAHGARLNVLGGERRRLGWAIGLAAIFDQLNLSFNLKLKTLFDKTERIEILEFTTCAEAGFTEWPD